VTSIDFVDHVHGDTPLFQLTTAQVITTVLTNHKLQTRSTSAVMSLLRASIARQSTQRLSASTPVRAFATTPRCLKAGEPVSQNPPSARDAGKSEHVSADPQSSASLHEDKGGDDHPAKQPDPQQNSDRSTGFGREEGVKGGKEGLGERTDRNDDGGKK